MTPGGVRLRRVRCQASLCSQRRAGSRAGAPRGPAAADANLCPAAQQEAGGLGSPAGSMGGWQHHPSSPGITSAVTSGSRVTAAISAGTGCHSMWGQPLPHPPVTIMSQLSPIFPSSSQCPPDAYQPEQAPLSHPSCGCHPLGGFGLSVTPLHCSPTLPSPTPDSPSPLNALPLSLLHPFQCLHTPDFHISLQIPPSPHSTRDPPSPYRTPTSPVSPPQQSLSPLVPHIPLQAIPGISWGCPVCYCRVSPLWEQLGQCGCPLTTLLKAVEAELGTE